MIIFLFLVDKQVKSPQGKHWAQEIFAFAIAFFQLKEGVPLYFAIHMSRLPRVTVTLLSIFRSYLRAV